MSESDRPTPERQLARIVVRICIGATLGVAGILSLRISPPPANRGLLLAIGFCCAYYGGFIALSAAVFVLVRTFLISLSRNRGDS